MGEKIARMTAAAFAVLLALGYFFLPSENVGRETNNSGMKKLELTAGDGLRKQRRRIRWSFAFPE